MTSPSFQNSNNFRRSNKHQSPDNVRANIATGNANVGVQGDIYGDFVQSNIVHGDVVYQVPSDATPEQKYQAGRRYLDGGMPEMARKLIGEAVMSGYRNSEVCFHWLLAFFSGRMIRHLSDEDISILQSAQQIWNDKFYGDDDWTRGLRVLGGLLDSLTDPDADNSLSFIDDEFNQLGSVQRDKILRHLELFLKGPIQDSMWARTFAQAREGQLRGKRRQRAWKFFHADPAEPRVLWPQKVDITWQRQCLVMGPTVLFGATALYFGVLALLEGGIWGIFVYLLCVSGGYVAAVNGINWYLQTKMLSLEDSKYLSDVQPTGQGLDFNFLREVSRMLEQYFAKYVPKDVSREFWLDLTAGVQRKWRREIVEAYRGTGVKAANVEWLIRYLAKDARMRYQNETLWEARRRFITPVGTKRACAVGGGIFSLGFLWLLSLVYINLFSWEMIMLLASGWGSVAAWVKYVQLPNKWHKNENEDARRRMNEYKEEFKRWCNKLAGKPEDSEIAAWLDCDRKLVLAHAMKQFSLKSSDVIAYTFLDGPASSCRMARVRNGPWRFSKYRILVFLLTEDGVRQLTAYLNFETGEFRTLRRVNYRFDAISSVCVNEEEKGKYIFELVLMGGEEVSMALTVDGHESGMVFEEESLGDEKAVSDAIMDASGLKNSLRILEGVAAEGKEWISLDSKRGDSQMKLLRSVVHNLVK